MVWKPLPKEGPEFEAFMRSWRRTRVTRFLVDESLGRRITDLLREGWGADAEFAPDVGLGGRDDGECSPMPGGSGGFS
jgi:hypothetical protein